MRSNVTTHHYDTLRTGWNNAETVLTPANVTPSKFGLITSVTVDEQVDAQPLVMLNRAISGKGTHNVVYVATENNTVYAIDGNTGAILLSRHLAKPVPYSDAGYCGFNSNVIGIGATPVIDSSTGILYLIADTLVRNKPEFQLYALKLSDLSDAVSPVTIKASHTLSSGKSYAFSPSVSRSRSALLLVNGNVYAGFGSYCDQDADDSRGWVLGWSASTLAPLPNKWLTDSEATSPNDYFLNSIWMSGSGIASDGTSLYFVTANSDPSGTSLNNPQNLTESVVKLSTDLSTLQSSFTPDNYPSLDQGDTDFGAGGIMLLPTQSGKVPSLATALGKDGNLYLLNRASLGGYHTNENAVVGVYSSNGCWCAESYFTGRDNVNRVVTSGGNQLQVWKLHTALSPSLAADWSQNIESGQDGGFFTTVSSNGKSNGIIWAIGRPDGSNNNAIYLDAFDANDGKSLVSNMIAGYWPFTQANANLVPVVTNDRVYIGSYKQLAIFGLTTPPASAPLTPVAAPLLALPDGLHMLSGKVESASGRKLVLSIRSGTPVTVDASGALHSAHVPVVGDSLTVVGRYDTTGILLAQAINRTKSNPALWPTDH